MILCFHLNCGFGGDRTPSRKSRQVSDDTGNFVQTKMSLLMCRTIFMKGVLVKNGFKGSTRSNSWSARSARYRVTNSVPRVIEWVGRVRFVFGVSRLLTSAWPSFLGSLTSPRRRDYAGHQKTSVGLRSSPVALITSIGLVKTSPTTSTHSTHLNLTFHGGGSPEIVCSESL
jgi:hypothetical protein